MSSVFLTRLFRLFILLVFQILVFNHVHLLGYATPLAIGYMMVCFHLGTSRVSILLWGFAIGILFDMFSNTAGMGAASCTLMAMVQPFLLNFFTPRDAADDFTPSIRTIGLWSYSSYVLILMFILHGAFYLLDAFMLADWPLTLITIASGTMLATILSIFIDLLVRLHK